MPKTAASVARARTLDRIAFSLVNKQQSFRPACMPPARIHRISYGVSWSRLTLNCRNRMPVIVGSMMPALTVSSTALRGR